MPFVPEHFGKVHVLIQSSETFCGSVYHSYTTGKASFLFMHQKHSYLFLASLNTQESVLRTSRQSFWYQDYILMALGKVNTPFIPWARLLQTVPYQTSTKWQQTCVSVQLLLDRNVFFFVVQMPATASQTT